MPLYEKPSGIDDPVLISAAKDLFHDLSSVQFKASNHSVDNTTNEGKKFIETYLSAVELYQKINISENLFDRAFAIRSFKTYYDQHADALNHIEEKIIKLNKSWIEIKKKYAV